MRARRPPRKPPTIAPAITTRVGAQETMPRNTNTTTATKLVNADSRFFSTLAVRKSSVRLTDMIARIITLILSRQQREDLGLYGEPTIARPAESGCDCLLADSRSCTFARGDRTA